jgi:hypothetical protein
MPKGIICQDRNGTGNHDPSRVTRQLRLPTEAQSSRDASSTRLHDNEKCPSRYYSSLVWFFLFLFCIIFLSSLLCCNPTSLIWWRGWILKQFEEQRLRDAVLELLLILAEIQKTDLARTEVDFVGIKGGGRPPLPSVTIRRTRHRSTSTWFAKTGRTFHSAVTHFSFSCM